MARGGIGSEPLAERLQRGDEERRLDPDAYAAASEKAGITWL